MPSITGTCSVCLEARSKYRCPSCGILYCSINCYKGHKESCKPTENKRTLSQDNEGTRNLNHSKIEKENGELSAEDIDIEDEDRVLPEKLQQLGKSEDLKELLHNPHLRQVLSHLDQTDKKEKAIANAMQEPLFIEFADQCLKVVADDDKRIVTQPPLKASIVPS